MAYRALQLSKRLRCVASQQCRQRMACLSTDADTVIDRRSFWVPLSEANMPRDDNDDDGQSIEKPNDFHEVMAKGLKPYYKHQLPVVFRNVLSRSHMWSKAMENWKDWSGYLPKIVGDHHFDVEVGPYNNTENERVNISLDQYVQYLVKFEGLYGKQVKEFAAEQDSNDNENKPPSNEILYLAQNELPPPLLYEIEIPQVCSDATVGCGQGKLHHVMLWMGPPHATSPLHCDPLDNLLFQVVGRKRITVAVKSPELEPNELYAGPEHGQQKNTSPIQDLTEVNYHQYPNFPPVQFLGPHDTILEPGDAVFIPSKFWHTAKSLETSVSVNAWWM